MASFKNKPEKLKYLTKINTLDEIHRKHASNFELKKLAVPSKQKSLENLRKKLAILEEKPMDNFTMDDVKERSQIKEHIDKLRDEIVEIENGHAELDYYSRTSNILLEYYNQLGIDEDDDSPTFEINNENNENNNDETIEESFEEVTEEEEVNETKNPPDGVAPNLTSTSAPTSFELVNYENVDPKNTFVSKKLVQLNLKSQQKRKPKKATRKRLRKVDSETKVKQKSILSFFTGTTGITSVTTQQTTVTTETETEGEITENSVSSINSDQESKLNLLEQQMEQVVSNRATLFEEYMMILDKNFTNRSKSKLIRTCDCCGIEKTLIQSEGIYVCRKCGEVEHIIIESEVPNHKDSLNEKPRYPYKRINHLIESVKMHYFLIKFSLSMEMYQLLWYP
jgi:hypothetical protein